MERKLGATIFGLAVALYLIQEPLAHAVAAWLDVPLTEFIWVVTVTWWGAILVASVLICLWLGMRGWRLALTSLAGAFASTAILSLAGGLPLALLPTSTWKAIGVGWTMAILSLVSAAVAVFVTLLVANASLRAAGHGTPAST